MNARALIEQIDDDDDWGRDEVLGAYVPPAPIWVSYTGSPRGHRFFASRTKGGLYRQLAAYAYVNMPNAARAAFASDESIVERFFGPDLPIREIELNGMYKDAVYFTVMVDSDGPIAFLHDNNEKALAKKAANLCSQRWPAARDFWAHPDEWLIHSGPVYIGQ